MPLPKALLQTLNPAPWITLHDSKIKLICQVWGLVALARHEGVTRQELRALCQTHCKTTDFQQLGVAMTAGIENFKEALMKQLSIFDLLDMEPPSKPKKKKPRSVQGPKREPEHVSVVKPEPKKHSTMPPGLADDEWQFIQNDLPSCTIEDLFEADPSILLCHYCKRPMVESERTDVQIRFKCTVNDLHTLDFVGAYYAAVIPKNHTAFGGLFALASVSGHVYAKTLDIISILHSWDFIGSDHHAEKLVATFKKHKDALMKPGHLTKSNSINLKLYA